MILQDRKRPPKCYKMRCPKKNEDTKDERTNLATVASDENLPQIQEE